MSLTQPKCNISCCRHTFEDAVALAEQGFDGVELAIADPLDIDVDKLTQMLESYGLKVPALGTGVAYK